MKTPLCLLALLSALTLASPAAETKAVTNADVVKLVKAELAENVILLVIQNGAPAFDTTPDALIELKNQGVSAKIIEAMVTSKPAAAPKPAPWTAPAASPAAAPGLWGSKATRIEFDRVFLVTDGSREELKYTRAGSRTRGFSGGQQFAVVPGPRAALRIKETQPAFELILPDNAQAASLLAMGLLATRANGVREILIAGGFGTVSGGLPGDRNVPLSVEKTPDQSGAPEGFFIYKVRPASPLKPGEYALLVAKIAPASNRPQPSAPVSNNFYEFAVE